MKTKSKLALALIASAFAVATLAQQPAATGGAVVASEPGKAVIADTVEISAQVVGIDKAARRLMLKGPEGDVVKAVASDEVKNFNQIKVGDSVVVRYIEALTLELKKTKVAAGDVQVTEGAAKAKPGERPAVAGGREVSVIADVVAVDPAKRTITLKGPSGDEVKLNVQNPDQFKVVEKGDQIEVTYTEALAVSVEPGPKPAAKK